MAPLLSFSMAGLPRGQGRPRATAAKGYASIYKDGKDRRYEISVGALAAAAMAGRDPFEGPLVLSVRFRMPIPKSATKRAKALMEAGQIPPTSKPDLSNLLKSIEDGMNRIAFADDAQIVRGVQEKIYSETPGVDVMILAWEPRKP